MTSFIPGGGGGVRCLGLLPEYFLHRLPCPKIKWFAQKIPYFCPKMKNSGIRGGGGGGVVPGINPITSLFFTSLKHLMVLSSCRFFSGLSFLHLIKYTDSM